MDSRDFSRERLRKGNGDGELRQPFPTKYGSRAREAQALSDTNVFGDSVGGLLNYI